jgi:ribosomal-protein-alanine N-acetyltransferase
MALKKTSEEELEILFEFQLDKDANYMAAFTARNYQDKEAYMDKFRRLLKDPTVNNFTIYEKGEIAGSIAKFERDGQAEITYWLGKDFWKKGIAKNAIKEFLNIETTRPLHAAVAFNNVPSIRLLEGAGFKKTREGKGFANARGEDVVELLYRLDK